MMGGNGLTDVGGIPMVSTGGSGDGSMVTGLILGTLLSRGGLFGGNGGEVAAVEASKSNAYQAAFDQTILGNQTASMLNQCQDTGATISAVTTAQMGINGNMFAGFTNVNDGLCALGTEVSNVGYQGIIAGKDNTYALDKSIQTDTFEGYKNAVELGRVITAENNANALAAAECCCSTKELIQQTAFENYKGQVAAAQAAAECCCSTKQLIMQESFNTQLRDQDNMYKNQINFNDLKVGQEQIKCLISDTAKDDKIFYLSEKLNAERECNEKGFIAREIDKAINTTIGFWSAQAQFSGVTYPKPPFNGVGFGY